MIVGGEHQAKEVASQCRSASADHESLDVINFDRATVGALKVARAIWDYLLVLIDANRGPEYQAPPSYRTFN